MAPAPLSRLEPSRKGEIEDWPWLDQAVLTCQLHQGLIAHGEHLTSRCQGWTDDMTRQQGWAPEVA